jgi:hypothetical protein
LYPVILQIILLYVSVRVPSREVLPPGPIERERLRFRSPFCLSFKVPGKGAPPGSLYRVPTEIEARFVLYISILIENKSLVLGPYIPTSVPYSFLEPSDNQINPWTSIEAFGPRIQASLDNKNAI